MYILRQDIGKQLSELRAKRKIRLVDVTIGTAIPERRLYDIERGRANITLDLLEKLCRFYNVNLVIQENKEVVVESSHLHPQKPRRRR